MNVGRAQLESSETLRVAAIGSSDWLRTAATDLAADGVTVDGPTASDDDRLPEAAVDCVLTDDPAVVESVTAVPVVVAVGCDEPVEDVLAEGAADVVTRTDGVDSSMLKHRLERTVQWQRARRSLERRTDRLELVTETVPLAVFVIDDDGRILRVDGRALQNVGLEASAVVGTSVFDVFEPEADTHEAVDRALEGETVRRHGVIGERVFETTYRPIAGEGSVDQVVAIAVDETNLGEHGGSIGPLIDAVETFRAATSKREVFEQAVEIGATAFDLESVAVFNFDDEDNCLVPAAYSPGFAERVGKPLQMKSGESVMWEVYVSETSRLYGDVQQSPDVHEKATRIHSALYVPMGDHGVLFAATPELDQYDEATFEEARLLGAATEAALDRIEWTTNLHEQERTLDAQNERLEQLNRANRIRAEVEELVLHADSREEIETGVCDLLARLEECGFVWIGEPDPGGNQLLRRAQAGVDRDYLEAVTVTAIDDPAAEPSGRTAKTRRPTVIENVADAMRQGDWRTEALSRDLQSVVSIPLVYDGFLYGVCSMYTDSIGGFDDALVETLVDLGETVAYAIDTVKRKNALAKNDVTEVELRVETSSTLAAFSEEYDAPVRLDGLIPGDDGTTAFVTVEATVTSGEPDAIEGISDSTVLRETEGETLVQLQCSDSVLETFVETHDGWIRSLSADASGTTVCLDVPTNVEVRQVLAELSRRGLDVSLVARRTRSDDGSTPLHGDPRTDVLTELTSRQREVVQTAYHGGFFEWPRETTGEEIASSLDISPPAFHNHVRAVERKLFASLFEQGAGE